jgi:histidine triad (HIT) family protein
MVQGEIKPDTLYEDDHVLAFKDINPQAPVHFLVVPKQHIATLNDLDDSHAELIGRMYLAAKNVANEQGIANGGYRSLINCNPDAGQTVWHVHLHVLGGRTLTWPPG